MPKHQKRCLPPTIVLHYLFRFVVDAFVPAKCHCDVSRNEVGARHATYIEGPVKRNFTRACRSHQARVS